MTTRADVVVPNFSYRRSLPPLAECFSRTPERLRRAAHVMRGSGANADLTPQQCAAKWRRVADGLLAAGRGHNAAAWLRACADIIEREGRP